MRKPEKWREECMKPVETTKGPGAGTIDEVTERRRMASRKSQNSDYFLRAAKNQLKTDTPRAAVVLGYFAAENKVEEALALSGYEVYTHLCTIKGLSRVLEKKELARRLEKAYKKRKDVNYQTELGESDGSAEKYIEERIEPLIEEVNQIVEELQE